jgi:solute carrier family 15 oligopeptide transporter 1
MHLLHIIPSNIYKKYIHRWQLYYLKNNPEEVLKEELNVEAVEGIEFSMEDQGGIYTLIVSADKNGKLMKTVHQVVPPNSVSIYWQLPQIFVISVAEILFSVTGNEFVYSQVEHFSSIFKFKQTLF